MSESCAATAHRAQPDDARRRECDLDQGAGVRRALDAEMRAVGLRQRLGQRQTEAGPARAPASGSRRLPERFERRLHIRLAHADTGIAHAQHRLAAVGKRRRYDHLAARAGELDRVRQQIEHDLAQRPLVGDDLRHPGRERGANDDARAACLRLHDADALLRQLVEADIGECEIELAGLDLGKIEQVVQQRDKVHAGGVDVLEIFAVALVADRAEALRHHHLGETGDGVEWRANLVTDLGQSPPSPPRLFAPPAWRLAIPPRCLVKDSSRAVSSRISSSAAASESALARRRSSASPSVRISASADVSFQNGEQASLNRAAVAAGGHDRQRLGTVALSKSAGPGSAKSVCSPPAAASASRLW